MGLREDIREVVLPAIGYQIPLSVIETLEALFPNEKRPQLHKRKKTTLGWEFSFVLPAGMSYRQFAGYEENFRDGIGDVTTEMVHVGKLAILKVITNKIGKRYDYDWDCKPPKDMILPFPVGYNYTGIIWQDLSIIPHILCAGVTRSGKSNFIHVLINSLLHLPKPPRIAVIDLKALEYSYLSNHILLVTEAKGACQMLSLMVAEMKNRIQLLKQAGEVNIQKYNEKHKPLDYIVLIVDELAELDDEQAQDNFETLSALSAATGICLVAATQRPDAQTFKHFGRAKSNMLGRLSFRMTDAIGSRIILDNDLASKIPNIRGRAIWKFDDPIELQVPYLDPDDAKKHLGVMSIEQSTDRSEKRSVSGRNIATVGMGGYGCRAIANTTLSLLQSGATAIKQIGRAKAN